MTHVHPLGKDGAAVMALGISEAFKAGRINEADFSQMLAAESETEVFSEAFFAVRELLGEDAGCKEAAGELGIDVFIHRSVPYAVFSFLKNPEDFIEALMNAVTVRGDRDTIGAMCVGMVGAFIGESGIPDVFLERIERREYIEELADRLFEVKKKNLW